MNSRKRSLFDMLVGTGLYLLDPVRDRLADRFEELSDRAKDTYDTASDRIGRASRAVRGEDHHFFGPVAALLVGVGVGVGVGLLIAPASGEETRNKVAGKVNGLGEKVWRRATQETESATVARGA